MVSKKSAWSGLFWKKATARGAVWAMGLTLPITLGIKALTPDTAFLDQMWLAGIALFALLAGISLAWPEEAASGDASEAPQKEPIPKPERDILFDILSIGAVVATVVLVFIFF